MENYTYDEMICFKCKRTYSLTLQADSVREAISLFREIQSGGRKLTGHYFTLPIYEQVSPIQCSKCEKQTEGENPGPVNLDWNLQRNEYKQPFIQVKKGDKWVRPDRPESRSKEFKTLTALRNRDYNFTPDPDPSNHIVQCNCSDCYNRKASLSLKKQEVIGAYNAIMERLGFRPLNEVEIKSISVIDDSPVQPVKRNYDAEIGIGLTPKKHRELDSDAIDEIFDNFTFFWKDVAKAAN